MQINLQNTLQKMFMHDINVDALAKAAVENVIIE